MELNDENILADGLTLEIRFCTETSREEEESELRLEIQRIKIHFLQEKLNVLSPVEKA